MEISPLYHNTRPEGELLPQEAAAFDALERLGIDYDRVSSEPADNMEKCAAVSEVLGMPICKNLFLCNRQKTQFYLLLLEGDKVFKTKHLSAQLGCSRLSFAGEEDLARLLGVQPGSASLLCLLQDPGCAVQLVLDRPLLRQAYLGLHPCQNTSTLRIAMGDVLERVIPALGHRPLLVDLPEDPL